MKTNRLLISLFALLSGTACFAQTDVSKKVLMSLKDGERIVTNESSIELSYSASLLYLVVQQGKDFYVYENGVRKGPYKSLDRINIRNSGERNRNTCAVYDPDEGDNQTQYITYSETGEMVIKFNGKTYGPYKMVTEMHVPKDKSWFVALAMNNEMKSTVVSSDYPPLAIDGNASALQVSATGKQYLVSMKEGEGYDPELMKVDFSKMSQDQLIKFAQAQEEKRKKAGPPQAYVYTSGGKKFGPYPVSSISTGNPAFCKTGGGNWYMVSDNTLFVNGKLVKKFSYDEVSASTCNVWLSADGSKYAVTSYRHLLFSDGSSYPAPLKLEADTKNGKTVLRWISLENEKELVSYSKEL